MFLMVTPKHVKNLKETSEFSKIRYVECSLTSECQLNVKCVLLYSRFWEIVDPHVKDRITLNYLACSSFGNQSGP